MGEPTRAQSDNDRLRELIGALMSTEAQLEEILGAGVDAVLDPETGQAILLRQAQAELRLLLEQLPAIVWTVDRELRCTSMQGAGLAACGLRPGELVGHCLAAGLPMGTSDVQVREVCRRAMEGEPGDLIVQDAGRVWQVHLEALHDAEGEVSGLAGVALDTTARARAEAELRRMHDELEGIVEERTRQLLEANDELAVAGEELRIQNDDLLAARYELEAERQRYRDLFDLAPDGYIVTDLAGVVREANRAAASLLAVESGYLVGKPLAAFVDQRDRMTWYLHLHGLQAGEEGAGPWEMHLQPRTGEPFCAAVTGTAAAGADGQSPASVRWLIRDVTAQKRLEAERDAEHARLQAVLSSAPEGISVVDDQGRLLFVNRVAEELYARPVPVRQEYESHAGLMLCYPGGEPYDPRDLPLTRSALDGDTLRDVELDIVWPDGQRRSLLVNSAPVRGPGGGAVAVFQDITPMKEAARERELLLAEAREARRQSEEHAALLDAVIASMADGVILYDAEGNITRTNAVADGLLGLTSAYKDMPLAERSRMLDTVDAAGQPLNPEQSPAARSLRGETVQGEVLGLRALGSETASRIWLATSAAATRDGSGELRGGVTVFTDITELRHARDELEQRVAERTLDLQNTLEALQVSEERFRELAENIDEVFWLMETGTNRVLYVSPGYRKVWGWPATEEYDLGQRVIETIHPEDRERVAAAWQATWQEYNHEFRIVRPDGAVRWLRAKTFPVPGSDGTVRRIAGVVADITEQKRAQDAIVQMERLMVAARLSASLAHDINNPLQSAVGCLDLAREAVAEGRDPRQFLAVVANALDRSRAVILQLRSLQPQPEVQDRQPTDVRALLERQLPVTAKRSLGSGVEVSLELDGDLPRLMLMADPMCQVFQHLVVNALDAMPEGGQLRIEGRRTSEPDGVLISFSDTGVGVPPQVWEHLFEPFQSTKSEGLGLGLFISQNIVHQHGGQLTIAPRAGGGTVAEVWLPAA